MLYLTCPTCGYFLAVKTEEWEKKKKEICNNPELSESNKEIELQKLLISLNLERYCCRMRFMSYKDIVYDILPIPTKKN
jgi:DNA-directed RNA polymerase subunit N (RpoN/RPB10)